MLAEDIVEMYFLAGSQQICLQRPSTEVREISAYTMSVPFWRNEANVRSIKGNRKKSK